MKSEISHSKRSKLSCLPLLLAAWVCITGSAAAQPLEEVTVFQSGTSGYHTFRIPAIVRADDGTVLAFAEGRKNSASDHGNIDIVLRRSFDGGRTWGPLQIVYDHGAGKAGNPAPVVDRNTGKVILPIVLDGQNPAVLTSSDHGATWSAPTDITAAAKLPAWDHYAFGPVHGIQLLRGPHAGRLVIPGNHTLANQNLNPAGREAHVVYSDDGGQTWHVGGVLINTSGEINPNESTIVELTDGRVHINARNQGGTERRRLIGYSTDGGESFPQPAQVEPQLIDPVVQAALLRYSAVDQGDALNRILFSNPASESVRRRMTVRSSFDETLTWNEGKMIHRGPSAYSDMVLLSNGAAGLLYEHGTSSLYERIRFARWEAGWLDDPTVVQLSFDEKTSGTASPAAGAIRDSRGHSLHATAIGAPPYVAGDPRYTGRALRFDGSTDHVRIPDSNHHMLDFEAEDSFTLEVVFRTTAHGDNTAAGSGPLIAKDVAPGEPSYWLRVQNGRLRFLVGDGSVEPNFSSSVIVNDGQWHHAAAVRDAASSELRLYVDHELVGSIADTTTGGFGNSNYLLIGAFNAGSENNRQFIGDIDLVRISAAALVPSQFVQPLDLIPGDANRDGRVDISDLSILASNWQQTGRLWEHGDFTDDGAVTIADLSILAAHWQAGVPGGTGVSPVSFAEAMAIFDVFEGVVIPEPAAMSLVGLAGLLALRRQRRGGCQQL